MNFCVRKNCRRGRIYGILFKIKWNAYWYFIFLNVYLYVLGSFLKSWWNLNFVRLKKWKLAKCFLISKKVYISSCNIGYGNTKSFWIYREPPAFQRWNSWTSVFTKCSNLLLHAIHSPFYWQILKKTMISSGSKHPYKKTEQENLSLFMNSIL